MRPLAIGIDLGGTQIRGALVDATGAILARTTRLTPALDGADAVVARMAEVAREIAAAAGGADILGIGLSAPGPLDAARGIALATPTIAGFTDFPVSARLGAATGLPVILENDGIAAAIGEWRFGAGRGLANMVYVTISTGIGGGIVVDGRILHGRRGMAGHIGHMTIERGGALCACGNRGCFEAYGSGTAFLARARARVADRTDTILSRGDGPPSGADIFAAARSGDALARELVDEEAEIIGIGFANLLHLYSPDTIVVGGGMSNAFADLAPGLLAAMRRAALAPFADVPVVVAALGDNSGLVGAGALVFETTAG
ncbi:glucokinase [Aureimonas sp. Leaf454]|uniref:ROK family protein n=1 Tax=Aureimonas sp. Leaf454 TaxID=1736381 RepID=UPI0006F5FBB0|nr:ROK family protein [Aureimonas sp. Leaf454]KQT54552.1 glucokinase [Aureimonas sp. Leaf454]